MTARAAVLDISPRFRFALPIAALITYFLGLLLYPKIGDTTPILSVLPVIAAGRSMGSRAGLFTALFTAPLNTLVLNLTGHSGWDALLQNPEGIAGMAALIFLGVAVGRLIGLKADVTAVHAELDQLQDRNRHLSQAKDELIDRLSQDLRTPLHTMTGFLELLRDGKVADPDQQREFLMRAGLDANRLTATVDDLFDISCAKDGHLTLDLEAVDLNHVISETLELLRVLATSKGILLTHIRPKLSLIVKGDRRRLRRVLLNLLERAIIVSIPGSRVIVVGQKTDEDVTIQVIDQGGGMTPEAQAGLFNRDSYMRSPAEGRPASTVMGLYVIKLIIEAHGGQVGVKSTVGAGSAFHFSIPAKASDTSPPEA